MPYISADEYKEITGNEPPDDFNVLERQAETVINRMTVYRLVGMELNSVPKFIQEQVKQAAAAEIAYLDNAGGLLSLSDGLASAALGKYSFSKEAASELGGGEIGPGVEGYLIPTGLLYAGIGVIP